MNQTDGLSHALSLGKLLGNLLSLEMGARMAVANLDSRQVVNTQLPQVKTGDWVELNPFTNGDDLRQTLDKYNKRAPADCRVDVDPIVALRDALAHGRMFGLMNERRYLRLLKFDKKKSNNRVRVTLAVDMTEKWFRDNLKLLNGALDKIAKALDYEKRELET